MPSTWSDQQDKRLLVALVQAFNPGAIPGSHFEEVAKKLGGGYTASAVKQRFNGKLRELIITPEPVDGAQPKARKSRKAEDKDGTPKKKAKPTKARKAKNVESEVEENADADADAEIDF